MSTATAAQSAQAVLEVVPAVMRVIRAEMRRHRATVLTVPQFRALVWIEAQPGTTASRVAEHVGLTRPAATALLDGLVARGLVTRAPHPSDRRSITLTLTARGLAEVRTARERTRQILGERLAGLTPAQRAQLVEALTVLREVFAGPASAE